MLRCMDMNPMNAPQSDMPNGIGLALSYSFSQ